MRSNRRIGARFARTLMFAAMSVLCLSALSLSMFAVELQTQVRAAVTQSVLTQSLTAVQDRVGPTAVASESRTDNQTTTRTPQDDRAVSACNAGRRGDVEAIPSLIAMLGDDSKDAAP